MISTNHDTTGMSTSTIWVWYGGNRGTVTELRSSLQVNNPGASFKIVPVSTVITNVSEYNSAIEAQGTDPVVSPTWVGLVKVVVKATDGTLKLYTIALD